MNQEITNIEIEQDQLAVIVASSPLEKTKAEKLKEMFVPYLDGMHQLEKKISAIDKENPTKVDIAIARETRLAIAKNRTAAEKKKDELKQSVIIEGRIIDSFFGVINNTSKSIELSLSNIEKAAEIKEQQRRDALDAERKLLLAPYEPDLTGYELGAMKQETFDLLLDNTRIGFEKRAEDKRKEEELRVQREANQRLHNDRKNKLLPVWNFANQLNDYSELDEVEFDFLYSCALKLKQEHDTEQARIKAENELLKKQAEEKEAALKAEREAAAAKQAVQDHIQSQRFAALKPYIAYTGDLNMNALYVFADQEFEDILLEVRALFNKDEQERQAKELKEAEEKKQAEIALSVERAKLRAIETDKKAAALAIKKAERAPDKEKLFTLAGQIESFALPAVKSEEAAKIVEDVQTLLGKIAFHIRNKISEL